MKTARLSEIFKEVPSGNVVFDLPVAEINILSALDEVCGFYETIVGSFGIKLYHVCDKSVFYKIKQIVHVSHIKESCAF